MWPVRNKTIIGLKYKNTNKCSHTHVRNKTIIGLKFLYEVCNVLLSFLVRNKTIIGLKCDGCIHGDWVSSVRNKTIIGLKL